MSLDYRYIRPRVDTRCSVSSVATRDARSSSQGSKQCSKMALICLLMLFVAADAVPVRQSQGCNFYISLPANGSTSMTPPTCNTFEPRQCTYVADSPAGTTIQMQCTINIQSGSFFSFFPSGSIASSYIYWTFVAGDIQEVTDSNEFLVVLTDNCNTFFSCTLVVLGGASANTTDPPTTTSADPTTTSADPTTTPANETSPPNTTSATPSNNTDCDCGIKNEERVVGGQEVSVNEWPWHAGLRRISDQVVFCGAALIHPRWLVTAAHCLVYQPTAIVALLGYHDVTQADASAYAITVTIASTMQHEAYDATTVDNDIGLVQLATAVAFNQGIRPICLPFSFVNEDFQNEIGVVTGWGTTSYLGSVSNLLLDVELPVLTTGECTGFYGDRITDNMICTYEPGFDACQGDSGGPLSWLSGGKYYLIGIVSWGENCSEVNYPGVYAKVTKYTGWITDKVADEICSP
ncbi:proclotting enzyme-like [Penaeus monodon]|uniref:proclotting enzyme-like n=1 Tax=Penaeus monodon TaxID=6687 RepID=UPI0018A7A5E6|nr:proclotting enzyme-like [Penaeus monodon]